MDKLQKKEEVEMAAVSLSLEVDSELFQWFEEYCNDGLLDLDEELSAVVHQYMQEQLAEIGDTVEPVDLDEYEEDEEDDIMSDYDDEDES